jgi:hypothetical protein
MFKEVSQCMPTIGILYFGPFTFFFLLQNQRSGGQNRSCLGNWDQWEGWEAGEMVKEGEYDANTTYTWMQTEKKTPVETISQIGRWGIKENGRGGEFKYDIFDIW